MRLSIGVWIYKLVSLVVTVMIYDCIYYTAALVRVGMDLTNSGIFSALRWTILVKLHQDRSKTF